MAQPSQLHRFRISLSDIARSVYEELDFRVAQHPSESTDFLITRVLAYALNFENDLKFSAEGLHTPEEPCLRIPDSFGGDRLWIEIGNPSPKKLHKAAKNSKAVKVYTYKNPELLLQDLRKENVHRQEDIEIFSLPSAFLEKLASSLARDTRWSVTYNDGTLMVSTEDGTFDCEIDQHKAIVPG